MMGRFSLIVFFVANEALAQVNASGIEQLSDSHISVAHANVPHVESFIVVDPRDPQHLLAAAMAFINGASHVHPYVSFDGGKTWAGGRFAGDSSLSNAGGADPVLEISPSGVALFSVLAKSDGVDRTLVARSLDGGRTWRTSAVLPNTDRQWLAIDRTRRLFGGRTYLATTGVFQSRGGARSVATYLARSDDDGLSFPFRTLLSHTRDSSSKDVAIDAVPLEPLVTSRGLLVITLQGGVADSVRERTRRDSLNVWSFGIMASDDGGESFGPPAYAQILRSSVTRSPARIQRATAAGGSPRTAIDASTGRFRDRVYFVATDYDPRIDRYVVRVWSTGDFGKTWKTAVASDAPKGDVANPAIAVNRDGIVAVTWNDRRDDPKGQCWRLYAAISTDGGERFLPAMRLSDAPTCANAPRNWATTGSGFNSDQSGDYLAHFDATALVPTRFPMGGDTQGLASDANGVFHAAWINGKTGVLQLWHMSFRVSPRLTAQLRSASADSARSSGDSSAKDGTEDVTRETRIQVISSTLDFAAKTFIVRVTIENAGSRPLRGPFRAVMRHFLDERDNGMGLRNLAVANADSGGKGVGATWEFLAPGTGLLAPGARTLERELRFTFEGGVPDRPEGYLAPGFRIFAAGASR
jgi:hypothetical protein